MSYKYSTKRRKTHLKVSSYSPPERRKTNHHQDKISSNIDINDIFEELSNENKRLLNELLFANKCLKSLINFKTFVVFISNKFKTCLTRNECQKFEKLFKDIEDVKQSTRSDNNELISLKDIKNKPKLEKRNKRKQNFDSEEDGSDLESNENNNSTKKVVECQLCLQMFISSDDYHRHLRVHTNSTVKPFVCYIPCGRSYSSIQDLKYHSKECHSDHSIQLKDIKQNKSSIDSNLVSNQLKESLKTKSPKKLVKNVVNDNQNIDNSDNNSDDGRHSDGFEDSNDSDYIPPKTPPNVWNDDLESTQRSDSVLKQQNELISNQTVLQLKTKSKLIECQIKGCKQTFEESLSKQHFISVHKDSDLSCSVEGCFKTFKTYIEFVKHLTIHNPIVFTNESTLKSEVKSSTKTEIRDGRRFYICNFENCGKRFTNYKNLLQHKRFRICSETRQRPHSREVVFESKLLTKKTLIKCPIDGCNQTFLGTLSRQHLRTDHKDSDLNCSVDGCNQTFKTYLEFIYHLWTHPLYAGQLKGGRRFGAFRPIYKTEVINGQTSYICDVEGCGQRLSGYRTLYNHNKSLHQIREVVLKCQSKGCDYEYSSNTDLLRHKKTIHGTTDTHLEEEELLSKSKSSFSLETNRIIAPVFKTEMRDGTKYHICSFKGCAKRFTRHNSVYEHYRRYHTRHWFNLKCQSDGCDYVCHSNFDLMNHKKTIHSTDDIHLEEELWSQSSHIVLKKVMCDWPGCETLSASVRAMKLHFSKRHFKGRISKQFVCNYKDCGVVLNGFTAFNEHIKTHKDYRIKCEWFGCEYESKSMGQMYVHINVRHKNNQQFVCEICNKELISAVTFKRHMKLHTNSREPQPVFECDYEGCGRRFKTRSSWSVHRKEVHYNGPKNFKCDVEGCTSAFINNTKLKKHKKLVHLALRPFACSWPGCEYRAKTAGVLKDHEWVHKPEVARFVCEWPECDRTFRDKTNFRYHMDRHNNEMRYSCEWPGCEFRCVDHWAIKRHKQSHR